MQKRITSPRLFGSPGNPIITQRLITTFSSLHYSVRELFKDFIVMSKTMSGFDSPYIPGWDCHGIPIEIKDDGELGSKKATMSAAEVRRSAAQGLHPPRRFRPVGSPFRHDEPIPPSRHRLGRGRLRFRIGSKPQSLRRR